MSLSDAITQDERPNFVMYFRTTKQVSKVSRVIDPLTHMLWTNEDTIPCVKVKGGYWFFVYKPKFV